MTARLLRIIGTTLVLIHSGMLYSQSQTTPAPKHRTGTSSRSQHVRPNIRVSLRPRQLVVSYTCDQAQAIINDQAKFSELDVDTLNEVTAVWENCANEVHNKTHPKDQRVTVVIPHANDPGKPVEITTVAQNDLHKIHQICHVASSAFFAYAEGASMVNPVTKVVVTAIDVVTDSGHTDCDSFIHGTQTENPLVVLAPSIIAGSGVSMRILSMMGAGKAAIDVQAAVDKLGNNVKESLASTVGDVTKHPLIYVVPEITKAPGPLPIPIPTPPQIPGVPPKIQSCAFHPWSGCL